MHSTCINEVHPDGMRNIIGVFDSYDDAYWELDAEKNRGIEWYESEDGELTFVRKMDDDWSGWDNPNVIDALEMRFDYYDKHYDHWTIVVEKETK